MDNLMIPSRNAPTVIAITKLGGSGYGVSHDNGTPEQLGWDEMLAQVACLIAPAFVTDARDRADALVITCVNQGMNGWRLMVNGTPDERALPFPLLLARLIALTFPNREPGMPLFGPRTVAQVAPPAADAQAKD